MARLQDGSIYHHNLYEYMIHNAILQTMKCFSTIAEITCQPLGRLQDGSIHPVVCTAGEVPFGTTCQMSCHPGYTLYGAHTKQCTPDGNWAPAQGKSNQCSGEWGNPGLDEGCI